VKARVTLAEVRLLDPQGKAIEGALNRSASMALPVCARQGVRHRDSGSDKAKAEAG